MASAFLLCGREALISINIQIKHNLSVGAPLNRRYINKGPGVIKVPFGLLPFLDPEEPGTGELIALKRAHCRTVTGHNRGESQQVIDAIQRVIAVHTYVYVSFH